MKSDKQILYPDFFPRFISSIMDVLVISLLFSGILDWIGVKLKIYKYGDMLLKYDIDPRNVFAIAELATKPEMSYLLTPMGAIMEALPMMVLSLSIMGFYFIGSWYYIGSTPMKYMLGMRIVDVETLEKPKLSNLIWRFIGYSLFMFGIWFILFTEKRQALHDRMGNSTIIKA